MNYRFIAKVLGRILMLTGAFMIPALLISVFLGERRAALAFAVTIGVTALTAGLTMAIRLRDKSFFAREGFVTTGLAWTLVSVFGALPFLISGEIADFPSAFFEVVSGFTTTGSSVVTDIESMSKGLVYWRSFTHWLGGMGVLVFLLAIGPIVKDAGSSMHLMRAESPGVKVGKLVPRIAGSAKILYFIYIGMTVIQIILLLLGDMPLFDAVTITYGTAGTGGFGIKNDSMASYTNYQQNVVTIFMILFSVNFNVYFLLLSREFIKAFRNEELLLFIAIIVCAISAISLNIRGLFDSMGASIHHAAFQVASIISTSGYSSVDFDQWPEFSRMILLMLMFVGACAGSTGGGIKVVRLAIIMKSARAGIIGLRRPNTVTVMTMDGEPVEEETVNLVHRYMMAYIMIYAISVLLVSIEGFSLETSVSAVASCLNNIGPGLGAVGPMQSFSIFSSPVKLLLSLDMLLGRLELFPVLMLFTPAIWTK